MKLLKFYTKTCCQCKVLSKQLEGFNLVPIVPIDCQDDPEDLSIKFEVRALPTLALVDDSDNLIAKFTGPMTKDSIEKAIQEYLE